MMDELEESREREKVRQSQLAHTEKMAAVGTANLDNRSFRLNFEITGMVADAEFVGEVERMFARDFERSREMTPADVDGRSFWFKLATRVARLSAPPARRPKEPTLTWLDEFLRYSDIYEDEGRE